MKPNDCLMSIGELKQLLSLYSDDFKIDFGNKYLAKLNSEEGGIVIPEWIDKAKQDAANKEKRKEELLQYAQSIYLPIENTGLSKRLKKLLKNYSINTIVQLAENTQEELIGTIRGLGAKSLDPIHEELINHGWYFGGDFDEKYWEAHRANQQRNLSVS